MYIQYRAGFLTWMIRSTLAPRTNAACLGASSGAAVVWVFPSLHRWDQSGSLVNLATPEHAWGQCNSSTATLLQVGIKKDRKRKERPGFFTVSRFFPASLQLPCRAVVASPASSRHLRGASFPSTVDSSGRQIATPYNSTRHGREDPAPSNIP